MNIEQKTKRDFERKQRDEKRLAAMMAIMAEYPLVFAKKVVKAVKQAVKIEKVALVCPGGRHAWYDSNIGMIRKPFGGAR